MRPMHRHHPQHQPRKRFGQNFLRDASVIDRITATINPQIGQHLVEIGPGQGALTAALWAQGKKPGLFTMRDVLDLND